MRSSSQPVPVTRARQRGAVVLVSAAALLTVGAAVAAAIPSPPPPAPSTPGFPRDLSSAPDKARYDDAPAWKGTKGCTGGFTAGAKRLQQWIRANWGTQTIQGYNCRPNTADTSKTSIHGVGRASDWFRNASNAKQAAQVTSFIARLSVNKAAMARAMGVQYWIWNKQQYSVRDASIYQRKYTGPDPHTNHIHIEQNLPGSQLKTTYWKLAAK